MPITRKSPTVQARLNSSDFQRFSKLAGLKEITKGELAREAILAYIDAAENEHFKKKETGYIEKLDAQVDRLAKMIASTQKDLRATQTDVGAIFAFMRAWIGDDAQLARFVADANKRNKERREKQRS